MGMSSSTHIPSAEERFPTVSDFLEEVGRQRFEAACGHGKQVVSRAIKKNLMPAHWYFDTRDFCEELSIPVPEHLFRQSYTPRSGGGKQDDDQQGCVQPEHSDTHCSPEDGVAS